MNAVITKPINPQQLFATLVQCLAEKAPNLDVPQQATAQQPVWDAEVLPKAMGDFPKIHQRLIAHFLSLAQVKLPQLEVAVDQARYLDAAEEAHKLKSAAKTVGALRFGDLCDQLETAGRSEDIPRCRAIRARLHNELAEVTDHINALAK
jgi:HPt (histidine-containing phosphotransfer) domain-containing protein